MSPGHCIPPFGSECQSIHSHTKLAHTRNPVQFLPIPCFRPVMTPRHPSTVAEETVQALQSIAPTKEEGALLRLERGAADPAALCPPERFVLALADVPRLTQVLGPLSLSLGQGSETEGPGPWAGDWVRKGHWTGWHGAPTYGTAWHLVPLHALSLCPFVPLHAPSPPRPQHATEDPCGTRLRTGDTGMVE